MRNDTWTRVAPFCAEQKMPIQNVYTFRAMNKTNKHWMKIIEVNGQKPKLHINESFLYRVKWFKEALTEEAHTLYFKLSDIMSIAEVGRYMTEHTKYTNPKSWNSYLSQNLFKSTDERVTILDTRINGMMLSFVKRGRKLLKERT